MAFHPVSHVLAVAGDGTEVTFWDPKARRRMEPSLWLNDEGPGGSWINSIAFTADGSLLAAGDSRGFVTVWDTSSHQRLHRWNAHSSAVNGLTFGGDPEMLATVGSDGFVGLWKKESFERVRAVQSPLPYDGVDLRRASGLTVLRRATLCALGAQTETPAQTT
jgi:WD40 repeat protein